MSGTAATAEPARRRVSHYHERTPRLLGLQIHPLCLP